MTIKKAYVDIIALLRSNQSKKVSSIIDEAVALATSKQSECVKRDEAGQVTEILCYYHKVWEAVSNIEFGKKASSATGLNSMCKQGVSNWTKQQRIAKQAKANLLDKVASGEIQVEDLLDIQADIEAERTVVIPRS